MSELNKETYLRDQLSFSPEAGSGGVFPAPSEYWNNALSPEQLRSLQH